MLIGYSAYGCAGFGRRCESIRARRKQERSSGNTVAPVLLARRDRACVAIDGLVVNVPTAELAFLAANNSATMLLMVSGKSPPSHHSPFS